MVVRAVGICVFKPRELNVHALVYLQIPKIIFMRFFRIAFTCVSGLKNQEQLQKLKLNNYLHRMRNCNFAATFVMAQST